MEKQRERATEREREKHKHTHMFVAEFCEWNYFFDYVATIFTLFLKEITVLGFAIELWSQIANPILSFAQLGKPKLLLAGRF